MRYPRKIAVFTSIRSEYGLLSPLLKLLDSDKNFELQLLVGGAHLSEEYGMTIRQIEIDGFNIFRKFPFLKKTTEKDEISQSLAALQKQIGSYIVDEEPKLLLVLGDRFELLTVVATALIYSVPIAHISGGEVTEGAIDNQIRHAITKMAHLHFPATEIYKKNLLKMGEENWRICVSGEPGLDLALNMDFIPKQKLFRDLGLNEQIPVCCCTFHPETIANEIKPGFVEDCLLNIVERCGMQILVTAANFDIGGREINAVLEKLNAENKLIVYVKSLGQVRYYSLLHHADLVVGNSSSGIVEVQSFNIPAINVGKRQKERLMNPNVISCETNAHSVLNAIELTRMNIFQKDFRNKPNIYGKGNASEKIVGFLKKINYKKLLLKKSVF